MDYCYINQMSVVLLNQNCFSTIVDGEFKNIKLNESTQLLKVLHNIKLCMEPISKYFANRECMFLIDCLMAQLIKCGKVDSVLLVREDFEVLKPIASISLYEQYPIISMAIYLLFNHCILSDEFSCLSVYLRTQCSNDLNNEYITAIENSILTEIKQRLICN